MNAKERVEWVKAAGACLPGADVAHMLSAAEAVDGPGRWEVSVSGGGLHRVGLRFFPGAPRTDWKAAAAVFGVDLTGVIIPELAAAWDLKTGRWTALRAGGLDFKPGAPAVRRRAKAAPFKPGFFKEPALDRALEEFHRLAPIAATTVDGAGWSLALERRLRWPLFARCDFSAAFTPGSSQRALLMLDRSVAELSFDGEALWAHCAG